MLTYKDEIFIVKCISDGYTLKSIAALMPINIRTLENRIFIIRNTYNAKSLAHLVAIFLRKELIN